MTEREEPDWRAVADTLATELRKCGWEVAASDYAEPVAAALAVYDDATGATDALMAREFHAAIVAILNSRDVDASVDETADAILEEFGLER